MGSNPFATTTTFELRFPNALEGAPFALAVYDLRGRQVAKLVQGFAGRGRSWISWTGTDASGRRLAAGLYVARLTVGGRSVEVKVIRR